MNSYYVYAYLRETDSTNAVAWNKGQSHSDETKAKISNSVKSKLEKSQSKK